MVDFLRPSAKNATTSAINGMSAATTLDQSAELVKQTGDFQQLSQEQKQKLEERLEADILDNVDVNFLFNKGTGLARGLINEERLYDIMTKLKELAIKQLEQGSKEINYGEIVAYVKSQESIFCDEFQTQERTIEKEAVQSNLALSEATVAQDPPKVHLGDNEEANRERKWQACV